MDNDRAPRTDDNDSSLGGQIGQLFGAGVWIVLFFAIAGFVLFALRHWMS